jgi:DNA-binding MarR family transcriptional regulator
MSTPVEGSGQNHLGHLFWEISARFMVFAEPDLADTQLSLMSIGALENVAAAPGVTASDLARQSFKTQQAASQVTNRLERLGYIERKVGAGRGVGLYITSSGRRALEQGLQIEAQLDRRLQDLLGEERYAELSELLQQTRALLTEVTADS